MLMIRLARMGKKKQPFYRITVAEKKHPPLGKQVEFIGYYNPKSKELQLDQERAKYWLDQGAQYSRTIGMLLVKEGVLKKEDLPKAYLAEKKRKKKKEQEEDKGAQSSGEAKPADDSKGGEDGKSGDDKPADAQGSDEAKPAEESDKPVETKEEKKPEEDKKEEPKEESKPEKA